jgi:maleylpyruvate isomerase
VKLYTYWRSSSSYRVRIALNHKGLRYESVAVQLTRGEQRESAHRQRSPMGTVPVLEVDHDGRTYFLSQSVAIVEYLEDRWPVPPLFPSSPIERAAVRTLVETINSGIQPFHNLATLEYVKDSLGGSPKAWAEHFILPGLEAVEQLARRSAGRFLVGDVFTWADCCLVPQLYAARRFASFGSVDFPSLTRVEEACLSLSAVQAARPEAQADATPPA